MKNEFLGNTCRMFSMLSNQRNASKTTLRFHFTSVIIDNLKNKQITAHAGKYAGKKECLFTAGESANW